ncbi:uncharacterized protein LOC128398085 [Panonychus citri]|uniref:uncharacterized protein LOC128398085 n=1 Tax=Panonychus citri TaxID=50023 RepID=UPI0023078CE2|nr:uncharacterized protein LOC128398085 [Panonychus citri]
MGDFLPICLSDHFYHDVISSCSVMGDCAGCFHSLNYCVISLIPCRLSKYRASFKLNRSLKWFVRLVLRFDGRDFRSNGAGNTSKIALNRASFSLFKTLNVYNHLKPPHLIGMPNLRGHCFATSVLIPLFNSSAFTQMLSAEGFRLCSLINHHGIRRPTLRDVIISQSPNSLFWTQALYELYRLYLKFSFKGSLICNNIHPGLVEGFLKPSLDKPLNDLRMDHRFILLIRHLAEFSNPEYFKPEGREEVFLADLFTNLCSEWNDFAEKFTTIVVVPTKCASCNLVDLNHPVFVPYIPILGFRLDFESIDLTTYVYWPNHWAPYFLKGCTNRISGNICGGKLEVSGDFKVLSFPDVLIFRCPGPSQHYRLSIPMLDDLSFLFNEKDFIYSRIGYSCDFPCFKSSSGFDYEDIYHRPEPGDVENGWHSTCHIHTTTGWLEQNNGSISECPVDLTESYTETSLIFYELKNLSSFPLKPLTN